jgi:hypothetical protein
MATRQPCAVECDHYRCKLLSLSFTPSATPTSRTGKPDPGPKLYGNSWEKGVATDARGMPYLDEKGSEIPVKKFGETYRRKFEEAGLA